MARYTMDQLYNIYVKNYKEKADKTLMTRMFTKSGFETVYNALKKAGTNSNITREILKKQNLLSRERKTDIKNVAADKGLTDKEIKQLFKDLKVADETYADYEYQPIGSTSKKHFTDAQAFFAALINAGYTEAQAKEAYGY